MRYDLSYLSHDLQRKFMESVKDHCNRFEDNYYKVTYDQSTKEFLLVRVNYVVPNKFKESKDS
jgi:hypothetical protein